MVSFLHHWALQHFIEAANFLGRKDDSGNYSGMADRVRSACEKELWDGEWYIRGITKKGEKIGSNQNAEGKIFLESNSWAVTSDAVSPERGMQCMDAVYKHLFSKYGIHLVWPTFSKPDDDIGYITRVYPGIKENGAIFSHSNPWAIVAECKLGRGDRAMEFYNSQLRTIRTTSSRSASRSRTPIVSSLWGAITRHSAARVIRGSRGAQGGRTLQPRIGSSGCGRDSTAFLSTRASRQPGRNSPLRGAGGMPCM